MDAVWLEVTVETTGAELDSLSARLTGNGATGLVIEDEEDFKSFLEQNRQYWDYVDDQLLERMKGAARIKFYVTDDADGQGQLAKWMEGIDLPYTTARLRENDWATSWQKYYKPMAVGQRLYIVPEWERGEAVPDGRTALYLNPGLTFGTGSHASTRLCLEWVEEFAREGESALDLGCGSGILSIAALLLGSREAVGVDIDPKAVGVAYENAAMNGIGRTVIRSGPATCSPIWRCGRRWPGRGTIWCWPISWPTSSFPCLFLRESCWPPVGYFCVPALSTPARRRCAPPWSAMASV